LSDESQYIIIMAEQKKSTGFPFEVVNDNQSFKKGLSGKIICGSMFRISPRETDKHARCFLKF